MKHRAPRQLVSCLLALGFAGSVTAQQYPYVEMGNGTIIPGKTDRRSFELVVSRSRHVTSLSLPAWPPDPIFGPDRSHSRPVVRSR